MTQLQNILSHFFGVSVRPAPRERNTKHVEYWIHRGQDEDDPNAGIEFLYGDEWRKGKAIAADPPDDVFWVERVLVGENGCEYETLFERS